MKHPWRSAFSRAREKVPPPAGDEGFGESIDLEEKQFASDHPMRLWRRQESAALQCIRGATALIRPATRATFSRAREKESRASVLCHSAWGRLMIAVLGRLANVVRDLSRTRTGEGRARTKQHGQHMGRPSSMTAAQAHGWRSRG
jgi:hypothetical protein